MNTKNTPGPWTMRAAVSGRYPDYPIVGPNGEPVASVPIMAHGRSGEYARLIAAAPALLAALERIVAAESRMSGNNPIAGLCDDARAAIAAARGEG